MKSRLAPLALAAASLAFAGCVVQPADGPYVPPQQQQPVFQQQQPVYQPVQPRRGVFLQLEGPWQMFDGRVFVRNIVIERTRGGLLIENRRRGRQDFARRIAPGVFQDERGRVYQFTTNADGFFENPNNGRRLRLIR